MRIWLICHQFFPEFFAGTETVTLHTALRLQATGHQVKVISGHPELVVRNEEPVRIERYDYNSLPVVRFRKSAERGNRLPYYSTDVRSELSDMLENEPPPDIVHILHFGNLRPNLLECFKVRSIPTALTVTDFFSVCSLSHLRNYDGSQCKGPGKDFGNCLRHHLQIVMPENQIDRLEGYTDEDLGNLAWLSQHQLPESMSEFLNPPDAGQPWFADMTRSIREHKQMMNYALSTVDLVITPNKVTRQMLDQSDVAPHWIERLPFGLNKDSINRSCDDEASRNSELKLIFIGQIARHKGVDVLIRAIKQLPDSLPVKLSIFGNHEEDGFYSRTLFELAEGLSRIEFLGTFPNERIYEILSSHDVIVIPSVWKENTPMVLLASQAAGIPAIVSEEEGLLETVTDEKNGLTFKTGNSEELADCIARLATDRDLLKRLSQQTLPGFSIEKHTEILEELYKRCLAGATSSAP